jgi:hypothetical protein
VACLACVLVMPATVLLMGPLIFGAPHVMSEMRLLAQRVQIRRFSLMLILTPLAILILLRIAEQLGMDRPANSDVVLGCAALCVAALVRPGDGRDRFARLLVVSGISVFALYDTRLTTLLLAHLHNLIAVVFLFAWSRSIGDVRRLSGLMIGVAAAVAALGMDTVPTDPSAFITDLRMALAPGLSAELGYKLILVYAFAQLLHYVIWLVWMPRLATADATRGVAGPAWLAAVLIGIALLLPMIAMLGNPIALRDQYLALASFHGWLELAVLAYCGLRPHVH